MTEEEKFVWYKSGGVWLVIILMLIAFIDRYFELGIRG